MFSSRTRPALLVALLCLPFYLAGCAGDDDDDEPGEALALGQDTDFAYVERSISNAAAENLSLYQQKLQIPDAAPQDLNSPYVFSPGASLMHRSSLDVDAEQWSVLDNYFPEGGFDVKDLSVSSDGSRMLFAAHGGQNHPRDNSWNIYEYRFASRELRRIIANDALANSGQDTNPTYAADGRIVFSSDRAAGNPNSPVDNIPDDEEDEDCYKIGPAEKPSLLHIMSPRGEDILQLTYGNNHDTKTTTLTDGRVAFVRWSRSYRLLPQCNDTARAIDAPFSDTYPSSLAPPDSWSEERLCSHTIATPLGRALPSNHYTLLTISPDTEQLEQLYETVTIFGSDEEFVFLDKIVQGSDGYLLGVLKHFYNQHMGGNVVSLRDPFSSTQNTVFAELSPQGLTSRRVDLYPNQLSANGWYSAVSPYRDGSSRLLVSWSQCATETNGVNSFCRPGENGSANSQYGIWVYDARTDSRLPVIESRPDVVYTDLAMARSNTGPGLPFAPVKAPFEDNLDDSRVICDDPSDIPPTDPEDPIDPIDPVDPGDPDDPDNPIDPGDPGGPDDPVDPNDPSDPDDPGNPGGGNTAPIADAGSDRNVGAGQSVSLDGSESFDPDGDSISYLWSCLETSPESELDDEDIVGRTTPNPSFIPDEAVEYPIEADFVFIIDGSGSMKEEISVVRDGLRNFVEKVADPDNGIDGRFAVITFEERPIGSIQPVVQLDFTESTVVADVADQVIAAFDAIDTSWIGPEQREAGLEAIRAVLGDPGAVPEPLGLEFRSTARKNLIIATDEDSDGPYNDGDFEPPSSITDASADPSWQDEVDRTATWIIDNDAFVDLLIEPADNPSRAQYGDPAADRLQSGSERFDPDATLAALNDAGYPQSLQAQVLRAGLIARSYPVVAANDSIFVDSFFNSKVNDTIDNPLVGSYVLGLVVNDGELDSEVDRVSVRAFDGNAPPNAVAGPDQYARLGAVVELDGSASFDSDNGPGPISFLWHLVESPDGSDISDPDINGVNTANANFLADAEGDYILELEVYDGANASLDTDQLVISALATRIPPNAKAGANQRQDDCAPITVDASQSFDPDAGPDPLRYRWRFVSLPSGSALESGNIGGRNSVAGSFTPDRLGSYVLEVQVSDGEFSSRDNVMVVVGDDPGMSGEACTP